MFVRACRGKKENIRYQNQVSSTLHPTPAGAAAAPAGAELFALYSAPKGFYSLGSHFVECVCRGVARGMTLNQMAQHTNR